MERLVLLNPGPVNVTDTVKAALHRGDMCHREPEISELVLAIRRKLLTAFGIENDFSSVLISGSGTAALEMGVSSCLSPDRSILVIQNGIYGERIGNISTRYGFKKTILDYAWGQLPSLSDIEEALKRHSEIEVVAMVHHETTTGLLNPLAGVAEITKRYGRKLLVDAISSIGGDTLDFKTTPVDIVIGTANKCIQGFPGVSFVLARNNDLDRLGKIPPRNLYCNLHENFKAQEKGDTLFTPAIQSHYAFDQALDELIDESVPKRIERYRSAALKLRAGFKDMGLKLYLPEENYSNSLTSIHLPEGLDYPTLHDQLRERGFVIYAGQGGLNKKIFRIANMGDIKPEEFDRLLEVLQDVCFKSSGRG